MTTPQTLAADDRPPTTPAAFERAISALARTTSSSAAAAGPADVHPFRTAARDGELRSSLLLIALVVLPGLLAAVLLLG